MASTPSPPPSRCRATSPPAAGPRAEDPPGRPLVYVTFGTVFNKDLTTIGTVVEGVRELDVDVLVTLGPGADPAGLGAQPDNVDVRDYLPQEETLARAAAVVPSIAHAARRMAQAIAAMPEPDEVAQELERRYG